MSDRETKNSSEQTNSNSQPSSGCRMLRPSLFSSNFNSQHTEFGGKEAATSKQEQSSKINPFLKDIPDDKEESLATDNSKNDETNKTENVDKVDPLSMLTKNSLPKSNIFKSSIPSANSNFVFGQNVHERVVGENLKTAQNNTTDNGTGSNISDKINSSELLFANVIQQNSNNKSDKEIPKSIENKSLTEVAREYEESRAQKRKYEEVETFTGEENEINIVDINCKLFAFINSNWEERGRGSLRLNDSKEHKDVSRVVFRTSGNLRLLLNTKVWPDMIAERPSPKSLKITAMDNNGQIKIFLAMSRPDDINLIYNALSKRINILKEQAESDSDSIKENKKDDKEEEEKLEKETENNEVASPPKKITLEQKN